MTGVRRLLFVLIMGLGGVSILAGLGVWQVQRLGWKNAVIADLEARLGEPETVVTGRETPADNFTPARATGRFVATDDTPQLRFLTSLKPQGPGFRIITAFELETGARILVDRGYAPETVAPRDGVPPPPPDGVVSVSGALHWPREVSSYTPDPNIAERLVFARDVDAMAAMLDATPVMLVASQGATPAGDRWPEPLPPLVDLPNDHLGYAITWFAMATVWAVMTVLVAFRRRRD